MRYIHITILTISPRAPCMEHTERTHDNWGPLLHPCSIIESVQKVESKKANTSWSLGQQMSLFRVPRSQRKTLRKKWENTMKTSFSLQGWDLIEQSNVWKSLKQNWAVVVHLQILTISNPDLSSMIFLQGCPIQICCTRMSMSWSLQFWTRQHVEEAIQWPSSLMKGEKDGSTAFMALLSSHAGKDKWEESQKDHMKLFTRSKWNDKAYTLEVVTIYHWSLHIQLQEAVDHVNFKLPTKHSRRVGYLRDNIENPDPDVCAGIGQIWINTNNMRDNFELAVWKEEWTKWQRHCWRVFVW